MFRSSDSPSRPFVHLWLALTLTGFCVAPGCRESPPPNPVEQAYEFAGQGDPQRATELARSVPKDHPDWSQAQLLLARLAESDGDIASALQFYEAVPRDGSPASLTAAEAARDMYFDRCALADAARCIEFQLNNQPGDANNRTTVASIYAVGGERERADTHFLALLRAGQIPLSDLVAFSLPERPGSEWQLLQRCASGDPQDRYVRFGLAKLARDRQDVSQAQQELERLTVDVPDFAPAQALLGELYLEFAPERLEEWYAGLSSTARRHPDVWYVKGLWARQLGEERAAARCLWETLRVRPVHRTACYQLGQALNDIDPAAAAAFSSRARDLQEFSLLTERVLISEAQNPADLQRLLMLLMSMGRQWEAWAWASQSRQLTGVALPLVGDLEPLADIRSRQPPRVLDSFNLTDQYDLSGWPDPDDVFTAAGGRFSKNAVPRNATVRFEDQTAARGIRFTYFHSPDAAAGSVRIFESTGGGAGVVDLDQDGWPDLLLPQGERWRVGDRFPTPTPEYRDGVFRNREGKFSDVTDNVFDGGDDAYGQGCSVGDVNNDGFPDLYVANIGRNRLWLNQGDGTFVDGTPDAGIGAEAWTTSCVVLDLNADGFPDLYDVNYLQGDDVFLIECSRDRCSVRGFEGAPDDVLLSNGDGSFRTIPDATPKEDSKGLGIVALYDNDDPRPSLFVANDQVPNFWLRPTAEDGHYRDDAFTAGLAVNRDGQPTACMGIAVADVNGDRRPDLFVTNFESEANCLYEQRDGGFFADVIAGTGLYAPGIPYVGWGTQFADADNDGDDDLIVANGHVADFEVPGETCHMPLQLFVNDGDGAFTLAPPEQPGSLFERMILGRATVVLDWDQDGRQDVLVTCLQEEAIAAGNTTPTDGRWVRLSLHARNSARDAVGTAVTLTTSSGTLWRRLTAGDGYEASNERVLHFGIGSDSDTADIEIRWPSGTTSMLQAVPADSVLLVTEGMPTATRRAANRTESSVPVQVR